MDMMCLRTASKGHLRHALRSFFSAKQQHQSKEKAAPILQGAFEACLSIASKQSQKPARRRAGKNMNSAALEWSLGGENGMAGKRTGSTSNSMPENLPHRQNVL